MTRWWLIGLLALALTGCEDAVRSITKPADDLLNLTGEGVDPGPAPARPKYTVGRREVHWGARSWVDLDLEMGKKVLRKDVESSLKKAANGPEGQGVSIVVVRAWPGKWRHRVGPYGTLVLAREGVGLDGEPAPRTRLEVSDRLGGTFDLDEARILAALEEAAAQGLPENEAILFATKASLLTPKAVQAAAKRVREAYPAPLGKE